MADSALVVPTDMRGTIATRIGEAEERLRSSIAARINRNRAELARLQADEAEFAQCLGSRVSSPGAPTPTGGVPALSPLSSAKKQTMLAKEADSAAKQEALSEAIAAHSKVAAAGARTPPTAPASASRLGLAEASARDDGDGGAGAPLLLRMTVEIGDGRVGTVEVNMGDTYEELAAEFCQKHGLGAKALQLLTRHIAANVGEVLKEKAAVGAAAGTAVTAAAGSMGPPPPRPRAPAAPSTVAGSAFASAPAPAAISTAAQRQVEAARRREVAAKAAAPPASVAAASTNGSDGRWPSRGATAAGPLLKGAETGRLPTAGGGTSGGGGQSGGAARAASVPRARSAPRARPTPRSAPRARAPRGGARSGDGYSSDPYASDGGAMSDGEGMAAARRRRRREEDGRKPPRFSAGASTSTVEHARRTRAEELLAAHEQRQPAYQPSISNRSRRLAERARAAGGSVFDRLHHESEEMLARKATRQANELASENAEFHQATTPHALSSTSRALLSLKETTDGGNADSRSYGDRLYEQGMQAKHARASAARQAKQRELENDDCTFAPTLSSTSLALVATEREERRLADADPWSYHHLEHHRRAAAQLHLSRLYARDELRDNTFHPSVGRKSNAIARERRSTSAPPSRRRAEAPRSGDVHTSLHEDHKYKKRQQLLVESQVDKERQDSSSSNSVKVLRSEALHRLVHSNVTKEEELGALRDYLYRPQDPTTGQSLYQPKILRGPRTPRNREGEHAGKHMGTALHDGRHEIHSKRRGLEETAAREQDKAWRMPTDGRFTEGKSARLVRGARRARLKQIFGEMDAEGEGVIDGQQLAARLEELPLDVAEALRPVRARGGASHAAPLLPPCYPLLLPLLLPLSPLCCPRASPLPPAHCPLATPFRRSKPSAATRSPSRTSSSWWSRRWSSGRPLARAPSCYPTAATPRCTRCTLPSSCGSRSVLSAPSWQRHSSPHRPSREVSAGSGLLSTPTGSHRAARLALRSCGAVTGPRQTRPFSRSPILPRLPHAGSSKPSAASDRRSTPSRWRSPRRGGRRGSRCTTRGSRVAAALCIMGCNLACPGCNPACPGCNPLRA